ncbi:MAG: hypothetical protein QM741_17840 [Rudaea sp.]|uniref:hypothetical protein n=1 Tax=Rudaea sp. TaxID=2136325 RepID=UPI0039E6B34F
MPTTPPDRNAQAYVRAWQRTGDALERERLRELRGMSESESARRFVLLGLGVPLAPLRRDCGLVEQQRIFSRLRTAP